MLTLAVYNLIADRHRTNLESLRLTIPDMMTMTETSKITMIQVSTLMLTQLQTVTETVSGTCAAAPVMKSFQIIEVNC